MMTTTVGVECTFAANGTVRVKRLQLGEQWQPVEQGRQWLDQHGRHVLVMLPNNQVRQIVLRPD
ncbi:MAG TPA: hypothetical protein VF177_03095, partial [Anaerolineae bacterium]